MLELKCRTYDIFLGKGGWWFVKVTSRVATIEENVEDLSVHVQIDSTSFDLGVLSLSLSLSHTHTHTYTHTDSLPLKVLIILSSSTHYLCHSLSHMLYHTSNLSHLFTHVFYTRSLFHNSSPSLTHLNTNRRLIRSSFYFS